MKSVQQTTNIQANSRILRESPAPASVKIIVFSEVCMGYLLCETDRHKCTMLKGLGNRSGESDLCNPFSADYGVVEI